MKNPLESSYCPPNHFTRFLFEVSEYLYENGWYTQSYWVSTKCHSFRQVEHYLWFHCYTRREAVEIVRKLRYKTITPYVSYAKKRELDSWLGWLVRTRRFYKQEA